MKRFPLSFRRGQRVNSIRDLAKLLDGFGLPWANGGFRDGDCPAPPYIDIEAGYGESVSADNVGWLRWMPYDVALYVRERDYELEKRFESALDAAEFNYSKTVTPLDGDKLVETAYEIDVTED